MGEQDIQSLEMDDLDLSTSELDDFLRGDDKTSEASGSDPLSMDPDVSVIKEESVMSSLDDIGGDPSNNTLDQMEEISIPEGSDPSPSLRSEDAPEVIASDEDELPVTATEGIVVDDEIEKIIKDKVSKVQGFTTG
ncbi:MAG: hypothetical protein KKH98_06025, partial [Spirochaetes bacterium]|nr:hypothetical protein [Spirochaetota bacterium]